MKPLREEASDDLELQAANLLIKGSSRPVWTAEDREGTRQRIIVRSNSRAFWPRLGWQLPLALAGSFAMLAFALVHQHARSTAGGVRAIVNTPKAASENDWSDVDLGAVGKLRVRRNTFYRLPVTSAREYRIGLDAGTLCAEIAHRDALAQGALVIQTPQIEVLVIGTRFCVEVRGGISRVSVTQGRIEVRAPSGTAFVSAGETLNSDDARLRRSSVAARDNPPPWPSPRWRDGLSDAETTHATARRALPPAKPLAPWSPVQRSMPAAVAPAAPPAPSSLAEQNALYSQGATARDRHDGPGALAAWGTLLRQFPQGVLASEAAAGILGELVEEGRDREALAAADDYLGRFPADRRAAEVAFIRGNLLREKFGRTADALAAYQQALGLATRPRLKDDALFAVGACERILGQTAAAREAFARYQADFPAGVHSGEVSQLLSEGR